MHWWWASLGEWCISGCQIRENIHRSSIVSLPFDWAFSSWRHIQDVCNGTINPMCVAMWNLEHAEDDSPFLVRHSHEHTQLLSFPHVRWQGNRTEGTQSIRGLEKSCLNLQLLLRNARKFLNDRYSTMYPDANGVLPEQGIVFLYVCRTHIVDRAHAQARHLARYLEKELNVPTKFILVHTTLWDDTSDRVNRVVEDSPQDKCYLSFRANISHVWDGENWGAIYQQDLWRQIWQHIFQGNFFA